MRIASGHFTDKRPRLLKGRVGRCGLCARDTFSVDVKQRLSVSGERQRQRRRFLHQKQVIPSHPTSPQTLSASARHGPPSGHASGSPTPHVRKRLSPTLPSSLLRASLTSPLRSPSSASHSESDPAEGFLTYVCLSSAFRTLVLPTPESEERLGRCLTSGRSTSLHQTVVPKRIYGLQKSE